MASSVSLLALLPLFLTFQVAVVLESVKAQTPEIPTNNTSTTKSICPAQLGSAIDAVVNQPLFRRSRWGILIQNQASGATLYSRDAQNYFIPASTTKLFTTAVALQQLGANYRIRTSVYGSGNGIVRVVGRGDPSLSDAQLVALARQLKQKGIREIKQLIIDDNFVRGEIIHPSWQWEDVQSDYGAPVNSLIVNQNLFSLRLLPQTVGQPLQIMWTDKNESQQWQVINQSVTVAENQPNFVSVTRDLKGPILRIQGQLAVNAQPELISLPVLSPAEHFLRRFDKVLRAENIPVAKALVANVTSQNEVELAAVESPPLSELVSETNIESNNLFAESLLRAIAVKNITNKTTSSSGAGLEVLKETLTQLGVEPTSYVIVDGSGLSRKNLISPDALVQILQVMANSPVASVFRSSLPIAGRNGTLKNRLRNTPAEGIVQAKTGTMTGVVSLAGYVNAPQYSPVVFSIMVNQTEQPARVVRQAMDEIVILLAQLQRC